VFDGVWIPNFNEVMLAASKPTNKKKRDPRQVYPVALRVAEKALGYTAGHIARVLRGERVSAPTLRAYNKLAAKEAAK